MSASHLIPDPAPSNPDTIAALAEIAGRAGLHRVHLLSWRDLDDPEAGGSEVHAAMVARLWAEAGIEVTLRTSFAAGQPPVAERDGYRVIRRAGRYLVFPRAALAEIARNHGPRDGLVEIWNGMPFFSPVWTRGPKIIVLHHVHAQMWGMVLPPALAKLGNSLERRVAPPLYRGERVVTLSESSKTEIVEDLGFPAGRVDVVPPGVHPRFSPAPGPRTPPPPNVVAVGRLVPVKRFDYLIRACTEARRLVPDLTLTIVGSGYEHDKLDTLVRRMGNGDWVNFVQGISNDELVRTYREARLIASASAREGWGMTLTEAAACGTPAVATRIAGHTDAVAEGISGLLADSEPELGAAIAKVCADDALWTTLSEGALEHASRFTWDATALGVLKALAEETQGRGHRGRTGRWR
jgi:glycosyltransferase involved in cell wall biosynthesis